MVSQESRPITFAEGTSVLAVVLALLTGLVNATTTSYELEKIHDRLKRLEKINRIDEIGRAR